MVLPHISQSFISVALLLMLDLEVQALLRATTNASYRSHLPEGLENFPQSRSW